MDERCSSYLGWTRAGNITEYQSGAMGLTMGLCGEGGAGQVTMGLCREDGAR